MFDSKFKKEVGFIKGHSSKKNLLFKDDSRNDSSDSFSSFEYNPVSRKEEFSPYRHPIDVNANKKQSKNKSKQESSQKKKERKQLEEPKFTNLVLRNNFIKDAQTKKAPNKNVQNQIEEINKKINEVKNRIVNQKIEESSDQEAKQTPKLVEQNRYLEEDEQLSLSNINRFQKAQESSVSEALPRQIMQKNPKTLVQYKKYLEQSSQQEEEEEQKHFKKTVKPKPHHAGGNENEELIAEWDKRQFKDKSIKTAIIEHHKSLKAKNSDDKFVESKGGIYFEIDKKQFKANPAKSSNYPKKKKKIEVTTREQLIIRRETAKRYDREVRMKLFGYA